MKEITGYIKDYYRSTNKKAALCCSIFIAVLIVINYLGGINKPLQKNNLFAVKLIGWWAVFLLAFSIPYLFIQFFAKQAYTRIRSFRFLIFFAPLLFALKATLRFPVHFSNNPFINNYWYVIFYWPALLLIVGTVLFLYYKYRKDLPSFYGFTTKQLDLRPYALMLIIMLPLIGLASTQADFLSVYPKLKMVTGGNDDAISWWKKLLFELSYGADFITIELFFRGFLVLAFIKWAGKDAILPMACFYCSIHFGKPMGECISSYFGGLLLGIIVYNTRSVIGGLFIHLGIAWMMEAGGYIGNHIFK